MVFTQPRPTAVIDRIEIPQCSDLLLQRDVLSLGWKHRGRQPPCCSTGSGAENNDARKISRNDRGGRERRNRNGLPRTVALEQQRANTGPSAARVHRLRRAGPAEEFP